MLPDLTRYHAMRNQRAHPLTVVRAMASDGLARIQIMVAVRAVFHDITMVEAKALMMTALKEVGDFPPPVQAYINYLLGLEQEAQAHIRKVLRPAELANTPEITFEEAKAIVIAKIGPECGLIEGVTKELETGWYFNYQSNQFLATGDYRYLLVGSGGFIVEKRGGHIVQFGSAYPLEKNLQIYEAGFAYHAHDLTITTIFHWEKALELLMELNLRYAIVREQVIVKTYTREMLGDALQHLPHTFYNQRFYYASPIFNALDDAYCCDYTLSEYITDASRPDYHKPGYVAEL